MNNNKNYPIFKNHLCSCRLSGSSENTALKKYRSTVFYHCVYVIDISGGSRNSGFLRTVSSKTKTKLLCGLFTRGKQINKRLSRSNNKTFIEDNLTSIWRKKMPYIVKYLPRFRIEENTISLETWTKKIIHHVGFREISALRWC